MRRNESLLARSLLIVAITFFLVPRAVASGTDWIVVSTRGAALALSDHQWSEIASGDAIADGEAVRTLQTGQIELQSPGVVVRIGPDSALRVDHGSGRDVVLTQYAGLVSASVVDSGAAQIDIRSDVLRTHSSTGTVTMQLTGGKAVASTRGGEAIVLDVKSGRSSHLKSRQVFVEARGETPDISAHGVDASGGSADSTLSGASGNGGGNENGKSGNSENGNGNNGSGNGNGKGNGNSGGNGNSKGHGN